MAASSSWARPWAASHFQAGGRRRHSAVQGVGPSSLKCRRSEPVRGGEGHIGNLGHGHTLGRRQHHIGPSRATTESGDRRTFCRSRCPPRSWSLERALLVVDAPPQHDPQTTRSRESGSNRSADPARIFLITEMNMVTYNVVDADGHVLEPPDLVQRYIDPAFRDQAPYRWPILTVWM